LEDLVRAVVREFPLVEPNVGKECSKIAFSMLTFIITLLHHNYQHECYWRNNTL